MSEPPTRLVHRLPIRIYFEDTDAGGLVYHANYLKFAERARTELLRQLGLDHPTLEQRHGILFAVRRCVLDFLTPGRLDDHLEVRTEVLRCGGASLDFHQEIVRDETPIVGITCRIALIDRRGRPARMPAELKRIFTQRSVLADGRLTDV